MSPCSKLLFGVTPKLGGSLFLIRGNEEILCIQNTKDFFVSPYEVFMLATSPTSTDSFFTANFLNNSEFFPVALYGPVLAFPHI